MNVAHWYAGLQPREQAYLRWGSLATAVLVLAGVVLGAAAAVEALRDRVAKKQADLAWIEAVTPRLQSLPAARPGESLALAVDRVARETGVAQALAGAEPAGTGSLRVRFERVGFDAMVLWLGRLQQERGAIVESASLDAAEGPGLVNASLVLQSP